MIHRILAASSANEVFSLLFNETTCRLTIEGSKTVGPYPSWITSLPGVPNTVIACLGEEDGKVVALKYTKSGESEIVGEASTGGDYPCYVLAVKNELFVANYATGSLSVQSITRTPPHFVGSETLNVIKLEGTGPNNDRQDEPYMHQAFYLSDHNEILVPNLAGDRIHRLKRSPNDGKWKPFADIRYPPGSGPRHVQYYEGHLYCVMELSNQVAKSKYAQAPTEADIKSTLSNPPPAPHSMLAAELLIPQPNASYPTPYVYISNRGDPSPKGDTIAIFSHDTLELLSEVRTGLKVVRAMMFGGEDDKYLIAGGAEGGGFKIFERLNGGKGLKVVAALGDESVKPTAFYWSD